jgi:hypothetical protein
MDFGHFVQLIAIGLQARVPMHITGFPGVGKTEFTKSLGNRIRSRRAQVQGLHPDWLDSRTAGLRGLSGFDPGRRTAAAHGMGARCATSRPDGYMVVVFLDEPGDRAADHAGSDAAALDRERLR